MLIFIFNPPFLKVALGLVNLAGSIRQVPLRFHAIRAIINLARCSDVHVPLGLSILDPLHASEMHQRPAPSTAKLLDLSTLLKVSHTTFILIPLHLTSTTPGEILDMLYT